MRRANSCLLIIALALSSLGCKSRHEAWVRSLNTAHYRHRVRHTFPTSSELRASAGQPSLKIRVSEYPAHYQAITGQRLPDNIMESLYSRFSVTQSHIAHAMSWRDDPVFSSAELWVYDELSLFPKPLDPEVWPQFRSYLFVLSAKRVMASTVVFHHGPPGLAGGGLETPECSKPGQ